MEVQQSAGFNPIHVRTEGTAVAFILLALLNEI